jgi:hypothetical protein
MTYDTRNDSIFASELDVEALLETLRRFAHVEQAATTPIVVSDASPELLGEIAMPDGAAWLAPIALAKQRQIALWSDDVAQRRLAHAVGVEAFGTTTLQQIRMNRRMQDEAISNEDLERMLAERETEVLALVHKRIVDVPLDVPTVIRAALDENWDERVALVTIGRPGWWHMSVNGFVDLRSILREAASSEAITWRYHAMWGVGRLASGEPSRQGTLLAAVALLPTAEPDVAEATSYLAAATQIGKELGAHDAWDYLLEAEALLVEVDVVPAGTGYGEAVRARAARGGA